jgi:hypothetical protein
MGNAYLDRIKTKLSKKTVRENLTYLNVIGIILFIVGLGIVTYSFLTSLDFIIGLSGFDASWMIRLVYLIIITVIGGYLVRQAATLLGDPPLLSVLFVLIGLIYLAVIFWTAQIFLELNYAFSPFTLIGTFFFCIMVAICLFFFAKGISDLVKLKNSRLIPPAVQPTGVIIQNIPPAMPVPAESGPVLTTPAPDFKICPNCLSKIAINDAHCEYCGKEQG